MVNLANTLDHLCQFALQLQHKRVEVLRQLSHKTYNSGAFKAQKSSQEKMETDVQFENAQHDHDDDVLR